MHLVKNYKAGDETHSPWPVRCYARDGRTEAQSPWALTRPT